MSHKKDFRFLTRMVTQRIMRAALTVAASFRTRRLIIFLTPGYDLRLGGVLSIAALYRESVNLGDLHRAKVVLCTLPGDSFFFKYSWFENRNYILNLESLLKSCGPLDYLLLHIPEYKVNHMLDWLNLASQTLLQNVRELHLNVLVQNIDLVPGQNVTGLKRFGRVTCTTAHEAYTNPATREMLGVTLHRLGTRNGPELYSRSGYHEKEPLLVVSHDDHPLKDRVLRQIAEECPHLRIQVVKDLSYGDYEKLIRRAKWSLTFGEGLDGYFVDEVFNGGVSFAVFNPRFFTSAFANLETVYPSWEDLVNKIGADLKRLDEPANYKRCWQAAFDLLCDLYSTERFRENLRMFYRGDYTFP